MLQFLQWQTLPYPVLDEGKAYHQGFKVGLPNIWGSRWQLLWFHGDFTSTYMIIPAALQWCMKEILNILQHYICSCLWHRGFKAFNSMVNEWCKESVKTSMRTWYQRVSRCYLSRPKASYVGKIFSAVSAYLTQGGIVRSQRHQSQTSLGCSPT